MHEMPVDGETVAVRATTPPNPLRPVTVIVEFPGMPTVTLIDAGLAAMVKSWTTKVTVVEWDREPLVPVTVTWTVEAVLKLQDNVALPGPITLAGETAHDVLFVLRLTPPAKPLLAPTEMVEMPEVPTSRVTDVGLPTRVKSVTANVTVAE